eukprot:gene12049-15483_t
MVAFRHQILLAIAAFHHSRSTSARSIPDGGGGGMDVPSTYSAPSTPSPMATNFLLTKGSAVARTESGAFQSQQQHQKQQQQHPKDAELRDANAQRQHQQHQQWLKEAAFRDSRANAQKHGNNYNKVVVATMSKSAESERQPPQLTPLPSRGGNPLGITGNAAPARRGETLATKFPEFGSGDGVTITTTNIDQRDLQLFDVVPSAWPPKGALSGIGVAVAADVDGRVADGKILRAGAAARAVARLRRADGLPTTTTTTTTVTTEFKLLGTGACLNADGKSYPNIYLKEDVDIYGTFCEETCTSLPACVAYHTNTNGNWCVLLGAGFIEAGKPAGFDFSKEHGTDAITTTSSGGGSKPYTCYLKVLPTTTPTKPTEQITAAENTGCIVSLVPWDDNNCNPPEGTGAIASQWQREQRPCKVFD